jgi:phage scaffold protein|nr:MAG TPA: Major capsid protein [Caudoviricetes sp.]
MSEEINGTTTTVDQTETVDTQNEKAVDVESNSDSDEHKRTFTRAEIGKMLAAERTKWEAEQATALEQAKSEGERLAKLTKDERAREEEAKRIAELEKRERVIAEREMKLATQSLLADEGLPQEFLDHVLAPTAEEVKAKITALRDVFDSEVEKRVNERLVQSAPRRGTTTGITKEQIMAIEDTDKRQAAIAENINLFRKG